MNLFAGSRGSKAATRILQRNVDCTIAGMSVSLEIVGGVVSHACYTRAPDAGGFVVRGLRESVKVKACENAKGVQNI